MGLKIIIFALALIFSVNYILQILNALNDRNRLNYKTWTERTIILSIVILSWTLFYGLNLF